MVRYNISTVAWGGEGGSLGTDYWVHLACSRVLSLRYFELALTHSGYELVTNPIPFDAVALGSDEQPAVITTDSLVTCENDAGNNDDECPDSRLKQSGSIQMKVKQNLR